MIIDAVDAASGTDGRLDRNGRLATDSNGRIISPGTIHTDQVAHPNAILVSDVNQMVNQILARAGTGPNISRLRFFGHALPGYQGMANSYSSNKIPQFIAIDRHGHLVNRADLERLRGHFAPNAVVELHGCNVALGHHGRELLRQLAELWNVRVRGGAERQFTDSGDLIEGPIIEAVPVPGHSAMIHRVR